MNFKVAYFSAEIGLSENIPTYCGGLGVLAGDHVKAAADMEVPLCAITLLYKEGYIKQQIDEDGNQRGIFPDFDPEPMLEKLPNKISIEIEARQVWIQIWKFTQKGETGFEVPVYFLDTDIEQYKNEDREITHRLYGGDNDMRLLQEAILGFGGMELLKELGVQNSIEVFHLNEGHCAFLTLDLLKKYNRNVSEVRKRCVFTTHTPVPAGHDRFELNRCRFFLGNQIPQDGILNKIAEYGVLNMSKLGLFLSRNANGVSRLHGQVAQKQFPNYKIGYITNGVYHPSWLGNEFQNLYNDKFPEWKKKPETVLNIDQISDEEILNTHKRQKSHLLNYVNAFTRKGLTEDVLTIGFARRMAGYKRAKLIFNNLDKLIQSVGGKIQIIYSGKAHPNDEIGKRLIREIVQISKIKPGNIKIAFVENYNIWLGKLLTSGVDIWLNTPLRPNEACGTSGMKAALNGVLNLSIRDGWWDEGCKNGINGWAFGDPENPNDVLDAEDLYRILQNEVIPLFYDDKTKWVKMMREAIKTSVDFTAKRMMKDYLDKVYKI
ncbi:MAG: alpha-glucan family phosphorylase [Candidatus Cloacimonadota bacterium]|nr:alpha-glucan family phosphorylase [Candidatus Cloacimonadota bacterium]